MSIFKILNELTVNGKPVEEDDVDDDYTKNDDEENTEDNEENKTDLDLNPNDNDNNEEQDGNSEEEPDEVDDDYTLQAQSTDDNNDTSEGDTGNDGGLDLNPDDTNADNNEEPTDDQGNDTEGDTGNDGGLDLNPDDTNTDDNTEEPTDDQNNTDGDMSDDDYTSENPDDTNSDDQGENSEDNLEDKIKQTEAEIFNTLTDEEKAIKNRDLIDSYIDLKSTVKLFLEKVRTVTITDSNQQVLHFVEYNLVDLSKIISDYIIDRYNSKSYIENYIFYHQLVLTITQLKDIISKLKPEDDKKE